MADIIDAMIQKWDEPKLLLLSSKKFVTKVTKIDYVRVNFDIIFCFSFILAEIVQSTIAIYDLN